MPDALPHVEAVMTLLDGLPASCTAKLGGRGDAVVDKTHSVVVVYPDPGEVMASTLAGNLDSYESSVWLHGIGFGAEQALWALDQARALLLGVTPSVDGRATWRIWQEQSAPLQRDDDITPPLYVAAAELRIHSDPA